MPGMSSEHGTYFEADGSKADFADAMAAWVPIAHEVLLQTAGTYNGTTTYRELTDVVQHRSGVHTRMLIGNWSGKLLEKVAVRAAEAGEPPLTSLCVHQDGTIGEGYRRAPKSVAGDPDTHVDDLAAYHRLLCYRRYADDLPADGGIATLTPQVVQARARRANRERTPAAKQRDVCPVHFTEPSATGACDKCD